MITRRNAAGVLAAITMTLPLAAAAKPPIWDSSFGTNTGLQADDDSVSMALGLDFPFLGDTYNYVSINSNGGVALGNDDVYSGTEYVDYDIWEDTVFESEFTDAGNPMILPFQTDLDNGDGPQGDIFFKSDGFSATITWVDMATHESDTTPFITFQLRLDADGTIVMGWRKVQAHLINDLSEGIVVGVSDGGGSAPQGSLDMDRDSPKSSGSSPHAYEIWCYDDQSICYESSQPENTAFDLEDHNLIFTANGVGGFQVESRPLSDGSGGALAPWGLGGLLVAAGLGMLRRRSRTG